MGLKESVAFSFAEDLNPPNSSFWAELFNVVMPAVAGMVLVVWSAWKLFWKVDRRSQQEIAAKNIEIARLSKDLEEERRRRFEAEERAAVAETQNSSMVAQIQSLTNQVHELRNEVVRLREQISHTTTGS